MATPTRNLGKVGLRNMQVIGLCRFSYPALGGFQVLHDTTEDRMAYLWSKERLEERFRLLETVALPCLRAQADPDFDLLMLISDQFPKHHEDRLRDLTADLRQVTIRKEPPHNNRKILKFLLNEARRDPSRPCIQFRHDDDDACAVDFVEKLRAAAHENRHLVKKHKAVAFDWNQGYVAEISKDVVAGAEIYRAFYVSALGMHIRGDCNLTIHNFMHERIPRYMPCVTYNDAAMFIRTHNGYNDSRQKEVKAIPVTPLTPDEEALFLDRFAVDINEVKRVFAKP